VFYYFTDYDINVAFLNKPPGLLWHAYQFATCQQL